MKKESAARANSSRMLTNANVQEYLRARMKDQRERMQIAQSEVLDKIQSIAFDAEEKTMVRLRALELLCRYLGILDQKDDLDREEQRARIERLRRETQETERNNISVSILGMDVEELTEVIG